MNDLKAVEVRLQPEAERVREKEALQHVESEFQESAKAVEENYNNTPIPSSAGVLIEKKRKRSGEFDLSVAATDGSAAVLFAPVPKPTRKRQPASYKHREVVDTRTP